MNFSCIIDEIGIDKKYGDGIRLSIFLPEINIKEGVKEDEKKKAEEYVQEYNNFLNRVHIGAARLIQIIDSTEIPIESKTENKK